MESQSNDSVNLCRNRLSWPARMQLKDHVAVCVETGFQHFALPKSAHAALAAYFVQRFPTGNRSPRLAHTYAKSPPASRASIFSPKAANWSGLSSGPLLTPNSLSSATTPALSLPTAALIFSGSPDFS